MKILVINGSPRRNGNTSQLMDLILDSTKKANQDFEILRYDLNDLAFKGCQGCMGCKQETSKGCVQADDLTPVLQAMQDSDAWVIGTPIYMGNMSGQLKLCVDRIYGFMGPNRTNRIPPGKKAVIAVTQGMQDVNQYKATTDMLLYMLGRRGLQVEALIAGGGSSSGMSGFGQETKDRAASLGEWLVATR